MIENSPLLFLEDVVFGAIIYLTKLRHHEDKSLPI